MFKLASTVDDWCVEGGGHAIGVCPRSSSSDLSQDQGGAFRPPRLGSILHEVQVVQIEITDDNSGGNASTDSSIGDIGAIENFVND
ncbi:hypothetical protein VNO78_09284 [Psophocarpus tetragonolobus]|uniref:Uncharacterized protein n=1 Tax=Psophocarpus tetragonolobus TaxID=3891 RepID=A0AAN9T7K7_PSOTE